MNGTIYQVKLGEPVVTKPLPVNARCGAEKTDDGGAADATVDHGEDAPVTVTQGNLVTITVTKHTLLYAGAFEPSPLPGTGFGVHASGEIT
ncbi:hypothetical protein AB0K48_14485 [Nonomuraea sp. NPDC055795]